MNLSECSPAGEEGVCLVDQLVLSSERLGICVCKEEGALGTNIFCSNLFAFNDGERKGSLSPVKKAGPAVDLVPELRTSYYLPSCVNITIPVPPNLGRSFLTHFQEDVTHILRYTTGSMPCMYSNGLTPISVASFHCQILGSSLAYGNAGIHLPGWICSE